MSLGRGLRGSGRNCAGDPGIGIDGARIMMTGNAYMILDLSRFDEAEATHSILNPRADHAAIDGAAGCAVCTSVTMAKSGCPRSRLTG